MNRDTSSSRDLFQVSVNHWLHCGEAQRPFPYVAEPREVACYSKDSDGRLSYGSRHQLRRFVNPPRNVDMNVGFETYTRKRHDTTCIDKVIRAVQTQDPSAISKCHFITYRNNLNKISRTPLATRDAWELECCLLSVNKSNGKEENHDRFIALEIIMTQPDPPPGDNPQNRGTYYGYKFEAVCTGDRDNEPVDANPEYCSISKVTLAGHQILVSSEIDATYRNPEESIPTRDYVELKTVKAVLNDRDLSFLYRHRYPKFWFQSFIAGVPTIVIGYRSHHGTLLDSRPINTLDMPSEANHFFQHHRQRGWDPAVMLNFTDFLLNSIRNACDKNPGHTIRVVYSPADCCVRAFVTDPPGRGLEARLSDCLKQS